MRGRTVPLGAICVALILVVLGAQPVAAIDDSTPPQLTALQAIPTAINTGTQARDVKIRATVTDAGSGFASGCAFIGTPEPFTPEVFNVACFDASNRVSGTASSGAYETTISVPRYSHRGFYPIFYVGLIDVDGNLSDFFPVGSDDGFTVSGTHDVIAPVITSVTLSPTTIDVGLGPAPVTFTVKATDALSGFGFGCVGFDLPPGSSEANGEMCVFDPDDLISGTANDGTYSFTYVFDATALPGLYETSVGQFYDGALNELWLGTSDLRSRGMPEHLTVTNSTATVPDAPVISDVTISPENAATVAWTPPDSDGGTPITSYTVTASPGGLKKTVGLDEFGEIETAAVIEGLQGGTVYTFTVHATNGIGDSVESAPSTMLSNPGAPAPPAAPTAVAGSGVVNVSWTPPFDGGSPITSYTVRVNQTGATKAVAGDQTTAAITGLLGATSYSFSVYASNAVLSSLASSASNPVLLAVGLPDVVKNPFAKGGDEQATISWDPPTNSGGTPITSYTVTVFPPNGGTPYATVVTAPQTSVTIPNLANGQPHNFTISATNEIGGSASVQAGTVWPAPPLPAPANVNVTTTVGTGSVTVSWSPVVGAASYTATHIESGTAKILSATNTTFTGLTQHTVASFKVRANHANGPGFDRVSNPIVVGEGPPPPPETVTAVGGTDGTASVSWSASTGLAVSAYVVTATPGGFTKIVSAEPRSTNFTELTNGTSYTFTVQAVSGNGLGSASAASNAVAPGATATVPNAPGSVDAVRGDQQATVSWSAPAANGSPITGYKVITWPGPTVTSVPASETSLIVSGLTNGVAHLFNVVATNAVGDSELSAVSPLVIPAGFPGAPANATATGGDASASVSWSAAAANGEPVTAYTVTAAPGGATTTVGNQTSAAFTGLTNGVTYTFSVRATNAIGDSSESSPSNAVTPQTTVVETGLPIVSMVAPGTLVRLSRTISVQWNGSDVSGIDHFEVRRRSTAWNAAPGAWSSWKPSTTGTTANDTGTYGRTYCYSARAEDGVGNMSNWTQPRCTVVPLNSDQLLYSTGWKRSVNAGAFAGFNKYTKTKGAKMTRTGIVAKSLSLVTTRCPTCGRVEVRWNGKLLKTWNLASNRTARKQVLTIATFSTPQKGTLTVTNVGASGKQVNIEGVAVYNG